MFKIDRSLFFYISNDICTGWGGSGSQKMYRVVCIRIRQNNADSMRSAILQFLSLHVLSFPPREVSWELEETALRSKGVSRAGLVILWNLCTHYRIHRGFNINRWNVEHLIINVATMSILCYTVQTCSTKFFLITALTSSCLLY